MLRTIKFTIAILAVLFTQSAFSATVVTEQCVSTSLSNAQDIAMLRAMSDYAHSKNNVLVSGHEYLTAGSVENYQREITEVTTGIINRSVKTSSTVRTIDGVKHHCVIVGNGPHNI